MKKWLIITGLLLLLLVTGFLVITKTIMPKAAKTFVPVKWQNIPLGQKRIVVHQYLGEPDSVFNNIDLWKHKLNNAKQYQLSIAYDGDTTAVKYDIIYEVKLFGFSNTTEVSSDSLR
jgi:hypothetical protein